MNGKEPIVLDACCGITLSASGYMREILQCLQTIVVPRGVLEEEIRSLSAPDEKIDLYPFIDEGILKVVELESGIEKETFVTLRVKFGAGESEASSIAIHRNWVIASDEKQIRNFLAANHRHIQQMDTPSLIKQWSEKCAISPNILSTCLQAVAVRARFSPKWPHPLADWWNNHVSKNHD